jgi:hypothetical protein
MNEDQDIQSHKMTDSLDCVCWTYLFKSIKHKFTTPKTHDLKDK